MNIKKPIMIDVSKKKIIYREATAVGKIHLKEETIKRITDGDIEKGDALSLARIAAILAAKKTSDIIPLCHQIPLSDIKIEEKIFDKEILIKATVKAEGKTGVEMEALTAVLIGLITIWDVVKQYEKNDEGQYTSTSIDDIRVIEKIKDG